MFFLKYYGLFYKIVYVQYTFFLSVIIKRINISLSKFDHVTFPQRKPLCKFSFLIINKVLDLVFKGIRKRDLTIKD